jgi:hypothetical protein
MALPPPARDILVSLLAFSLRRVSTAFSTIDSRFLKGCLVRAPSCCVRPPQRFTSILTVTPSRPNNCGTVSLVWLFSASVVDAATLPPKRATLGTRPKQRPRCPPLAWLSAVHSTPSGLSLRTITALPGPSHPSHWPPAASFIHKADCHVLVPGRSRLSAPLLVPERRIEGYHEASSFHL